MRYHELALQYWLNKAFTLRWGVPVPVVFTSPMDAFSLFSKLWSEANNPFQYLLNVKDEQGIPLYQPYPQPVRYPVMSVYRKGWKLRQYQNFSIHRLRHINYPTVSDAAELHFSGTHQQGTELTRCNLGNVTTSRMPMAFDYRFQIDHFCNRPDTQAFFTSQLFRQFWRTGGPQLQTWIKVAYPGFGDKLIRLYIDGDIENLTPEEPEGDKSVEYRTSFTLVIEGYDIDLNYEIYPAFWTLVARDGTAPPEALDSAFDVHRMDLREKPENSAIDEKYRTTVMPPPGTCATALRMARDEAAEIHEIQLQSLIVTFPGPLTPPGYPPPSGVQFFGGGTLTLGAPPYVSAGSFADSGTNQSAFSVGSMDLYIRIEQAGEPITFQSGTYFQVTVSGSTLNDSGTLGYAFVSGAHTSSIVSVDAGTEAGTQAAVFAGGTYADVAVNAGTYAESGSLSTIFTVGTYTAMVMGNGTYGEAGTQSMAFLAGMYV